MRNRERNTQKQDRDGQTKKREIIDIQTDWDRDTQTFRNKTKIRRQGWREKERES